MNNILFTTQVAPQWVDFNGHMNDAEYARVFSLAVESLMDAIGLDEIGRKTHQVTLYTLENHLCHLAEAHEGDTLQVVFSLLDRDPKRLHVFMAMHGASGQLVATSEQMLMAMGVASGRPESMPEPVQHAIDRFKKLSPADWPVQAGQRIGIRRAC